MQILPTIRLGFISCLSIVLTSLSSAAAATSFIDKVESWEERHQAAFEKAEKIGATGDTARATQLLIDLADKDSTGIGAFVVGNMLYDQVPGVSYRLHEKALKAFPAEPAVALEMAMEQHRKGEYAAAIPHYRMALQAPESERFSSLLADCSLRTGELKDAVTAWRQARHGENHSGIEEAIQQIYNSIPTGDSRDELLAQVNKGNPNKLPDLIVFDLQHLSEFPDSERNLGRDLKLAEKTLGAKSQRYKELAIYAKLARKEDGQASDIRNGLTEAKLVIGQDAAVPQSSLVARALFEMAVSKGIAASGELLRVHAAALHERIAKKDKNALHLVAWLTVSQEQIIHDLDRIGWKEWKDPEFAVSYIAGLVREKKIMGPNDNELLAALTVLPEDKYLNQVRLALAGEDGRTMEMLVAAIKAEYHEAGMESYTLKGLFYQLSKMLGMAEDEAPSGKPVK